MPEHHVWLSGTQMSKWNMERMTPGATDLPHKLCLNRLHPRRAIRDERSEARAAEIFAVCKFSEYVVEAARDHIKVGT